ncbi:hypothetical protein OAL09_04700 [Verrucomicrobia bacterium]|nr:hypothetical protein [Verrucomicrobiota bacterium]NCG27867.1 hypothetical protein [Verrucomicrobiales bacterium]
MNDLPITATNMYSDTKLKVLLLCFISVFSLQIASIAEKNQKLKFEIYSGYFVSNKFEPSETRSFVVAKNQKQFDQIFGVAFVLGDKSHRLEENELKSKTVIAAIRRGKSLCDFKIHSIINKNGVLEMRYAAKMQKESTASFACPLIISVPKGNYKAIHFIENGKVLKQIKSTDKK